MLKELGTYRGGHGRDVACAVWHPVHEELFSSGSHDGSLAYWLVSRADAQASPLCDSSNAAVVLSVQPCVRACSARCRPAGAGVGST